MSKIKTMVLLDPYSKIVSWGDDAWSCLDQVNITDEAEWDACIERGYRLCTLQPVTDATSIVLTPGVPTEDGWYTITTLNDESKPFYETIYFFGGSVATKRWSNNPIISFLKLPDL